MKSLNDLCKDKTAQLGMFNLVVMAGVVLVILAVVLEMGPVVGYQTSTAVTIPASAAATGTYTFSGNVSNGETINITNGNALYIFEFNTTANGSAVVCRTSNCIPVNLSQTAGTAEFPNPRVHNHSWLASGNLTTAINANTSSALIVTAANTSNVTTLTSVAGGTNGNSISLSDNVANVSSSGLSGGVDGSSWNSGDNTAITNGSELWQQNTPMISVTTIAIFAGLIIAVLLTIVGRRGGGQGSASI